MMRVEKTPFNVPSSQWHGIDESSKILPVLSKYLTTPPPQSTMYNGGMP
jgi:hypothetical protein